MPKFYVQTGPVGLIFDAVNAEQAAEEQERQLEDEIVVHEQGFDRWDGQVFETREVFEAWLRWPVPMV